MAVALARRQHGTHPETKMRGVGTGGNPASRKHLRCLSCGGWAPIIGACPRCGKNPRTVPAALDEPTKRCPKCGIDQPLSYFKRDPSRADGLFFWCRVCDTAAARRRRQHKQALLKASREGVPNTWKKGQRGLSLNTEAMVWRLLSAAQRAATAGKWQGHEGLRAYRDLRLALDEWRAPENTEESPIYLEEA